jgi:tetratricopeptide (TPR) repeat protein
LVRQSTTLQRIASISLSDATTQSRFLIWGEAWQGVKERPITGWGQENFSYVFNKFYNPEMYGQEQWFDRAHNEFIDWAVAGGIPAFLLYILLLAFVVRAVYKSELEVPEQAILLGLLAGYVFNNLFVFDNLISYIFFVFILAFVHGLSSKKVHSFLFMSRPLDDRAVAVAAPVVLVLLVWGGYFLNGPGLARAQTLIDALTPVHIPSGTAKDPKENLASFQQALADGPLGYQETVEQLFQFTANSIANSTSVSPDTKQQAYNATIQAADTLLKQRPADAREELFYAVFYDQFGQYSQALQHLQSALKDSPKKQQILFELGSTYLAASDPKDALPLLQQAFQEEPKYQQARTFYAVGLYYNGQSAAADKLLIDGFGTTTIDDQQLMQAYFTTKQYGRLAAIYQKRLSTNPTDLQSLVGFVVTNYFATGNKAAAIATLQKAATANPTYATQIQSFITQINNGTLKP